MATDVGATGLKSFRVDVSSFLGTGMIIDDLNKRQVKDVCVHPCQLFSTDLQGFWFYIIRSHCLAGVCLFQNLQNPSVCHLESIVLWVAEKF